MKTFRSTLHGFFGKGVLKFWPLNMLKIMLILLHLFPCLHLSTLIPAQGTMVSTCSTGILRHPFGKYSRLTVLVISNYPSWILSFFSFSCVSCKRFKPFLVQHRDHGIAWSIQCFLFRVKPTGHTSNLWGKCPLYVCNAFPGKSIIFLFIPVMGMLVFNDLYFTLIYYKNEKSGKPRIN